MAHRGVPQADPWVDSVLSSDRPPIPGVFFRTMVSNAIAWAKENNVQNNLVRVNPVHKAEEYRIATWEGFQHKDLNRKTTRASGEAVLRVGPCVLLAC